MKIQWKLQARLTLMALVIGIVPLIIANVYVGSRSTTLLQEQSNEYMKAKVEAFNQMAQTRYEAISGNLDVIREQLTKNLKQDLVKQASKERYFETGYLVVMNSKGLCVAHPNPEYINSMTPYKSFDFVRDAVNQRQGYYEYTYDGSRKIGYLVYNQDLDWIMWGAVPADEVFAKVGTLKTQMYLFLLVVAVLVVIVGSLVSRGIANKASEIAAKMEEIAQGEADLSVRLPVLTRDEMGDLAHWFNVFMENLEEVIAKVKATSLQVDAATQEVSSGAQGLSQATQEQASAIEEVAATIEEMTSAIKQNAANASDGREKARVMVDMTNNSAMASEDLMRAMEGISQASKKIGDIISTVNEVAFQTNLLALNAAVEAARAGEHGKGFAVVAEEVRALAQRSGDAARQIRDLIEDTVNKIAAGDDMVKKSSESLTQITAHIDDLSQTMEEIAASSAEQANGVDELNRAVAQIDSTTQQNASTVEELASTSDTLSTEARDLAGTVDRFKVGQENTRAVSGRRAHARPERPQAPARVQPAPQTAQDDDFEEF